MKGNEALAEAAIRAGCKCFFGYPITPQTELSEYLSKQMPKRGGVFLQAESEVAAINMVLGAGATGTRVMTSSSSPGVSLKSEGISYIAGSDVPCLIVNVERGGPGLGSIQPSQQYYWQATKGLGHGDFRLIILAPNSVQEVVNLVVRAFDLGEKYRVPVMLLSDGLLGQMMEPVEFPEISAEGADNSGWAAVGTKMQREHHIVNSLYIEAKDLEEQVRKRYERYAVIEENESEGESYFCDDADIVITAFGATSRIAKSAVNKARAEGIKAGLFRPITLWPFPKKQLLEATKQAKAVLSVEMNMGQMIDDVKLALDCKIPVSFYGRTGGVIPSPNEVLEEIRKLNGGIK